MSNRSKILSRSLFPAVKLEDIEACQIFLNKAIHGSQSIRLLLKVRLGFFEDKSSSHIGQRNADDDEQGQLDIQIKNHPDDQNQGHDGIDHLQKALLESIWHGLYIAGEAPNQITKLVLVKVRDRNLIDLMTELIAHVTNGALHSIGHEIIRKVRTNLIKEGTNKVEQHNPSHIAAIDGCTGYSFGYIQQILRQFCNGKT